MKGLNQSDFFSSRRGQALPNLHSRGVSSPLPPPSHTPEAGHLRHGAPTSGWGGFRGYPAPPSRPRPHRPPARVALPAASGSSAGGGSSRNRSPFSAAAGWSVSIKVFFSRARSPPGNRRRRQSAAEVKEATHTQRRASRRLGTVRRPPEKRSPCRPGRLSRASAPLLPALAPTPAPPRGLVGRPRDSAAREPLFDQGAWQRVSDPAAPPGGFRLFGELEGGCGGGGLPHVGGASGRPAAGTRTCIRSPRASAWSRFASAPPSPPCSPGRSPALAGELAAGCGADSCPADPGRVGATEMLETGGRGERRVGAWEAQARSGS